MTAGPRGIVTFIDSNLRALALTEVPQDGALLHKS